MEIFLGLKEDVQISGGPKQSVCVISFCEIWSWKLGLQGGMAIWHVLAYGMLTICVPYGAQE